MIICEKIQYNTRQDAEDAIVGMQKSKRSKNVSKKQPVSAYRCSDCGAWHISSERNGKNKKRKGLIHTHTHDINTMKNKKRVDYVLKIKNYTGH